jgi:prepilin-type N-terminal cleavage/methylation domain-containing protein
MKHVSTTFNWPRRKAGFTLIELVVVIGLIALIAAAALPTIMGLLKAGYDSQAYNLFTAMMTSARAEAVTENNYAALHVQRSDRTDMEGVTFAAVMSYNQDEGGFELAEGAKPIKMPGKIAFGEINDDAFDEAANTYKNLTNTLMNDFTTFSIVFNNEGRVVTQVDDGNVSFVAPVSPNPNYYLFKTAGPIGTDDKQIWLLPSAEQGATKVTLFDYGVVGLMAEDKRAAYMNDYGEIIPININTGQLFKRQ